MLVALQLGLIAALAVGGAPAFLRGQAGGVAWAALAASVAVGAWALTANRLGNFNVHPRPRTGGRLVTHGPYRWVRHPMYTAVLLGALAAGLAVGAPWAWAGAAALALVLWAKARMEERWMAEAHPGYPAYQRRTGRFLPGL